MDERKNIMERKIKSYEEMGRISYGLRKLGKIVVTTNGGFDIFHAAHIHLLERARNEGDNLIVLLNSDESIRKFKGDKRPIFNEKDRAYMLSSLSCVDYVVIFKEDKPLDLIERIKPQIHVKGGSYIPERIREEEELLRKWNGKLRLFDLEEEYSSTNAINKILQNYNGK